MLNALSLRTLGPFHRTFCAVTGHFGKWTRVHFTGQNSESRSRRGFRASSPASVRGERSGKVSGDLNCQTAVQKPAEQNNRCFRALRKPAEPIRNAQSAVQKPAEPMDDCDLAVQERAASIRGCSPVVRGRAAPIHGWSPVVRESAAPNRGWAPVVRERAVPASFTKCMAATSRANRTTSPLHFRHRTLSASTAPTAASSAAGGRRRG